MCHFYIEFQQHHGVYRSVSEMAFFQNVWSSWQVNWSFVIWFVNSVSESGNQLSLRKNCQTCSKLNTHLCSSLNWNNSLCSGSVHRSWLSQKSRLDYLMVLFSVYLLWSQFITHFYFYRSVTAPSGLDIPKHHRGPGTESSEKCKVLQGKL